MVSVFIDTRESAEKEAKADIRRARRAGFFPDRAAETRREMAKFSLKIARGWRESGELEKAVRVAKIARGHLIIARAWDQEATRIQKKGKRK